jgi:hypothetical protein
MAIWGKAVPSITNEMLLLMDTVMNFSRYEIVVSNGGYR